MTLLENIGFVVLVVFIVIAPAAVLYFSISSLRRRRPGEVYAIWLCWSFFIILSLTLGTRSIKNNTELMAVCGSLKSACEVVWESYQDIYGEVGIIGTIFFLFLVPQLTAYLISGAFGAGFAPRFIAQLNSFVVWSFIKILASFSGLSAGIIISILITTAPAKQAFDHMSTLYFDLLLLAAAFMFAALYTILKDDFAEILNVDRAYMRPVRATHRWLSRHVPNDPPYALTRAALIKLLESDTVAEFIAQDRQEREPHQPE